MKKIIKTIIAIFMLIALCTGTVQATSNNTNAVNATTQETLIAEENSQKSKIMDIAKNEKMSLEEYKQKYGSDTYGVTAYILDKVRDFSWPFIFIGIAFSAIYQYVIGIKNLENRNKGFNNMIAIITIGIICQILPVVFAIVVLSAGK
ncbi:MAG: hypothetical protein E7313_01190 [Clostridiales bacterium]|nr:hypothetical protein [Clostridiales bacterium]